MIKTTELMLGNLVEFRGKYAIITSIGHNFITIEQKEFNYYTLDSDINPIPLTEGVLKRLDLAIVDEDSVHQLQNYPTVSGLKPIDITPLLSPRYTTHDNVEVWEGDMTWRCSIENPTVPVGCTIDKNRFQNCHYFSTQQACQSYIDSQTRKPIFTTEDGVDMFEGDTYYYCRKSGYYIGGEKSIIKIGNAYKTYEKHEELKDFASPVVAQAYLNKVWADAEYQSLLK